MLDHRNVQLIAIENALHLAAPRIGIAKGQLVGHRAAVLNVRPDDAVRQRSVPVEFARLEQLREGQIAVSQELIQNLFAGDQPTWNLEPTDLVDATRIEVEIPSHLGWKEAANLVRDRISGKLVLVDPAADSYGFLHLDQEHFTTRELEPRVSKTKRILRITPQTIVDLYSPAASHSLDIVILADCSNSMGVPDLPVPGEGPMSRLIALKLALLQLLQERQTADGMESRLALVQFDTECQQVFPARGMLELSGHSQPGVIEEFRQAIDALRTSPRKTHIGNALDYAARLLQAHAAPDSTKVIVLVSDGNEWSKPKLDHRELGRMVSGVADPVSTMSTIYREQGVYLLAVGVSNHHLYEQWLRQTGAQDQVSLRPDHQLLEQLTRITGGSAVVSGDAAALRSAFARLSHGIARRVRPKTIPHPNISSAELNQIVDFTPAVQIQRQLDEQQLKEINAECYEIGWNVQALYRACDILIGRIDPKLFFFQKGLSSSIFCTTIAIPVRDVYQFESFVTKICAGSFENVPSSISAENPRADSSTPSKFSDVSRILNSEEVRTIKLLRHNACHNKSLDKREQAKIKQFRMQHLGFSELFDSDAVAWATLQLAVLRSLREIFQMLVDALTKLDHQRKEDQLPKVSSDTSPSASPLQALGFQTE
ncbi:MAG: VWA domain-containing protein [Pirellulaceae bacterium]|nr:VWA domain-containing protein [Pirellulaceae bacterium]